VRAARHAVLGLLLIAAMPAAAQSRTPLKVTKDTPLVSPGPPAIGPTQSPRWYHADADGGALSQRYLREEPGRPWSVVGASLFATGEAAMIGWTGYAVYATLNSTGSPDTSGGERIMWAMVIGTSAPIPIVAPFLLAGAYAPTNSALSAFFLTAGLLQTVGLVLMAAGWAVPTRWVKAPAAPAASARGPRWHLALGAPGSPLGASLTVDWPG